MTPMRPAAKAVFLLWMLTSPRQSSLASQLALFRRVLVSNTTLVTSRVLEFDVAPSGAFQHHKCSRLCLQRPWCDLFCLNSSVDQCLFSDMIVMSGYEEENMGDALTCYTRRQKDFATGAAIQGTSYDSFSPLRVKENLVDGIYNLVTLDQCYHTANGQINHWFVLDFGRPVPFRTVKFLSQASGNPMILAYLRNLEVRIGMTPVATLGDFSSYQLIGTFEGPATMFGEEIVIEAAAPVTGRYLSVQKTILKEPIQICHLEVY